MASQDTVEQHIARIANLAYCKFLSISMSILINRYTGFGERGVMLHFKCLLVSIVRGSAEVNEYSAATKSQNQGSGNQPTGITEITLPA